MKLEIVKYGRHDIGDGDSFTGILLSASGLMGFVDNVMVKSASMTSGRMFFGGGKLVLNGTKITDNSTGAYWVLRRGTWVFIGILKGRIAMSRAQIQAALKRLPESVRR